MVRWKLIQESQIEEVPEKEICDPSLDIHCLSNMITGQDKFRVVYHGSLKNGKYSLNDLLQASPDEDEKKVLKKVLDKLLEVQVQRILRNVLTFNY